MKTYTHDELINVITLHGLWLRSKDGGESADLSYADLSYANLCGANLRSANLRSANLRSADLSYADLSDADMRGANLCSANLRSANLSDANLSSANLSYADLSGANLSGAYLSGANLSGAKYGNRTILRVTVSVIGPRYNVTESLSGEISIGCEKNVTSETLDVLFAKYKTPEHYQKLYRDAVKMIEEYAAKFPILSEEQL